MYSNNGKKDSDKGFTPSSRYEKYSGSNPVMLEARERQRRESSKPGLQMESSSSTSAGGSKGKSK
ncbi:hypothetical protein [Wolbachia endosymbiont of Drosophila pseudotakahashii]|uniref:hypothetical protein n=1 Tax=Wolbachia endosymbiont of Drosophila pseudotakahashii TaxID=375919 RepID=UPI00225A17D3|nr:hypothetical protein [Wolbachia endosymbiont of Drosophila pseudotakahashii]MCX3065148.1 hypothetical protein [Wolbachia endosymbiont of Drosophila pseudotakahashii]